MLIYLDNCCIQRPLDDRSQPRINLEAKAIEAVLELIKSGTVRLLSSQVNEVEIRNTPDSERGRRIFAMGIVSLADMVATVSRAAYEGSEKIEPRCGEIEWRNKWERKEVDPSDKKEYKRCLDALHAAVAIEYHADYFCTADKRLLKKLKALRKRKSPDGGLLPYFVSPLELAAEIISQ
uniref:PIN domain-containing protein n=1 Tax=Candidatus Kentrum sp. FW TaxID=2126338 RepID=A0A450SY66_9GAMM|nr:MAG: hypothetical protein BECKFW1821B_GA0114236_10452 [Candidatus Kentron sp. FW]